MNTQRKAICVSLVIAEIELYEEGKKTFHTAINQTRTREKHNTKMV